MPTGSPVNVPNIIVNPTPCPWGFNPANRSATIAESIAHDLCELNAVITGRLGISDYLSELMDDLWRGLARVWDWIKAGAQWTLQQAVEIFQPLWDGIAQAWHWLEQEAGPWVIGAAAVALMIVFAPEVKKALR